MTYDYDHYMHAYIHTYIHAFVCVHTVHTIIHSMGSKFGESDNRRWNKCHKNIEYGELVQYKVIITSSLKILKYVSQSHLYTTDNNIESFLNSKN